jgi:hypothetical protein
MKMERRLYLMEVNHKAISLLEQLYSFFME